MSCQNINANGCLLHHEFEWAHERMEHLMKQLDRLNDIRFNRLPLLASRTPWLKRIKVIRREINIVKRRIRKIEYVIRHGCFLCKEGGIIFLWFKLQMLLYVIRIFSHLSSVESMRTITSFTSNCFVTSCSVYVV